MWCCIHSHSFTYRSVHILAGLGFSVLNFSSLVSWLLISVGSREFTGEASWEILSIVSCLMFFPQGTSPADLLCYILMVPCPLGAWMALSSHGSGVTTLMAIPPHTPHLGWCLLAQERAEPGIPSHQLVSAQPAVNLQKAGAFSSILIQGRASPRALGMDMPKGTAGAGCRDTQASPG